MIFPLAFFVIMIHLAVHLPEEVKLARLVKYRWMYPIEQYLCILKIYMHNKACLEGSTVEGYLAEECLTFCSRYLMGIDTKSMMVVMIPSTSSRASAPRPRDSTALVDVDDEVVMILAPPPSSQVLTPMCPTPSSA